MTYIKCNCCIRLLWAVYKWFIEAVTVVCTWIPWRYQKASYLLTRNREGHLYGRGLTTSSLVVRRILCSSVVRGIMVITISLNATCGFRGKVPPFVIINLKINCKTTENQLLLIIDTSSTARIAQKRVLNNHPKTWELSGVLPLWVSTMQGFALDSLGPLTPVFFVPSQQILDLLLHAKGVVSKQYIYRTKIIQPPPPLQRRLEKGILLSRRFSRKFDV